MKFTQGSHTLRSETSFLFGYSSLITDRYVELCTKHSGITAAAVSVLVALRNVVAGRLREVAPPGKLLKVLVTRGRLGNPR